MKPLAWACVLIAGVSLEVLAEDWYLPLIQSNQEVIACTDESSFSKLTSGTPLETLVQFCSPQLLPEVFAPTFTGWTIFGKTQWLREDGKTPVFASRKYVMETQRGKVWFVWPYPLEPSEYSMFNRLPEEPAKPAEALRQPRTIQIMPKIVAL